LIYLDHGTAAAVLARFSVVENVFREKTVLFGAPSQVVTDEHVVMVGRIARLVEKIHRLFEQTLFPFGCCSPAKPAGLATVVVVGVLFLSGIWSVSSWVSVKQILQLSGHQLESALQMTEAQAALSHGEVLAILVLQTGKVTEKVTRKTNKHRHFLCHFAHRQQVVGREGRSGAMIA